MNKIASPQDLQHELRALLTYTRTGTPSRARIASALARLADGVTGGPKYENARVASSKSYNDYLKEADREFLRDVAKQITAKQKHCQAKADN
jgi:hypothetical protein